MSDEEKLLILKACLFASSITISGDDNFIQIDCPKLKEIAIKFNKELNKPELKNLAFSSYEDEDEDIPKIFNIKVE